MLAIRDLVLQQLDNLDNFINFESNVHTDYDNMGGIEPVMMERCDILTCDDVTYPSQDQIHL